MTANNPPALLEIVDLSHSYSRNGVAEPVLRRISLSIRAGELVCLIGRSGCGKSTLLKIVAGFLAPTQGQCLLAGKRIVKPGPDRCVVFQEDALFPWLTVRENIAFGLGGRSGAQRRLELTGEGYGPPAAAKASAQGTPYSKSEVYKQMLALQAGETEE